MFQNKNVCFAFKVPKCPFFPHLYLFCLFSAGGVQQDDFDEETCLLTKNLLKNGSILHLLRMSKVECIHVYHENNLNSFFSCKFQFIFFYQ